MSEPVNEWMTCRGNTCEYGIYRNGWCYRHYQAEQREELLLAMLRSDQPRSPDDLPVKPLRVEWVRGGWAAYMPLPRAHEGQPCRDHPEDFFSEDGDRSSLHSEKLLRAITSCMACPDRVPCAEYGIAHSKDHGIWGGTLPKERARLLRARGQVHVELHGAWLADGEKQRVHEDREAS